MFACQNVTFACQNVTFSCQNVTFACRNVTMRARITRALSQNVTLIRARMSRFVPECHAPLCQNVTIRAGMSRFVPECHAPLCQNVTMRARITWTFSQNYTLLLARMSRCVPELHGANNPNNTLPTSSCVERNSTKHHAAMITRDKTKVPHWNQQPGRGNLMHRQEAS